MISNKNKILLIKNHLFKGGSIINSNNFFLSKLTAIYIPPGNSVFPANTNSPGLIEYAVSTRLIFLPKYDVSNKALS